MSRKDKIFDYFKDILFELVITLGISIISYIIIESSTNILVSFLDATSSRLKLDIKVIMLATYIYTFFKFCIKEKRDKNLWSSLTIKVLIQCILYFVILKIFDFEPLYIKFLILGIVIILSNMVEKLSLKYINTTNKIDEIFKYFNIFSVIIFIIYLVFF